MHSFLRNGFHTLSGTGVRYIKATLGYQVASLIGTGSTPAIASRLQTAELSRTVGDNDIALFTEISGDRNPCSTTTLLPKHPDSGRPSYKAASPVPSSTLLSPSNSPDQVRCPQDHRHPR
ncbi:hypothetical protein [Rhodococcus wratislaviensis]|uniref:hypothetical protein n=1 Tax=Rhodococcus wratislaviensis TaxID=44752 RepID=UPI0035121A3E